MANDSPDPRRKQPHSSDDDDESRYRSKRHKHRHHHRRHHRHSSRSKDHDDGRKVGADAAANGYENVGVVEQAKEGPNPDKIKADSDMEEGEILEDGEFSGGGSEPGAIKAMSDSESGEIRVLCAPSASNTRVMDHEGILQLNNDQLLVNNTGKTNGELKSPENDADAEVGYESNKVDKVEATLHRRSRSPAGGKNKHKGLRGVEVAMLDRCSRLSQSPSHGRYRDEGSHRSSRSKSPSYTRRKSHSQSIAADEYLRQGHSHDYDGGEYVLDEDGVNRLGRDSRHQGKDLTKHRDKETRYVEEYRHHDHEVWDRESKEKYRDRKMEKETKMKYRDHEEERQHHERDRYPESSRVREAKKEREDSRKGEKRRERSRDDINDGEYDDVMYREKDYRSSRTRDLQGELRRGSSRSSYIDRDMDKEREDRVRHRDRSRDVSERQKDDGSDRHRNKDRDVKSDRVSRHYGRVDEDGYGGNGRSYDSKHRVNASEDYHRNGRRMANAEKDRSFRNDSLKESEDKVNRDRDDQDEYPENMELDLVEQEEEDINRIKEESRKRREAILQKYRTQELQKKVEPQSDTSAKEPEKKLLGEPSGLLLAARPLQGRTDDKINQAFPLGKSPSLNEASTFEKSSSAKALGEGTPKSERSNDMFCDDIFGDSLDGVRKTGKGDGVLVERSGLHDNWDDPEGYYGYRLGEILDGRFEITAAHGKGVFSTVVRAKDLKAGSGDLEEVAIKIIRSNDTMLKAGMEELVILKKLVGADPDDRRHCVRYISSFKYRNHLCLVFESLHMNLREVLKKFGRNIGLKLTAVRAYSKQLFIALKHLKNCGVLHCDIKPDNMLVNDAKNVLKLCDFGNAMFAGKNEVTPYLVSRFYRAPEIILGLAYDHPLDMWSVGCCMYELYTGKVLFPGSTNNDMLRLHMELKGPFPKKMLRKGAFTDQNFDHDLNFLAIEEDVVTKKSVRRLIVNIKPKDIGTIMKGSPGEDPKMLANFKDLLDKIFVLDPDKRLTVSQALSHPFITGK